jgi:hypothetical protein
MKLWEVSSGKEIRTFAGHSWSVTSVAFSPDGRCALSGSEDKTMKLWEVSSGKEIRTFAGHSKSVNSVAFSPDGRYSLSGSRNDTLKLWEVSSGKEIRTFTGDSWMLFSVAFSPDGRFAISSSSNRIRMTNMSNCKEIAQFISFTDGEWISITPEGYYNASVNGGKHLNVRIGNDVYSIDQFEAAYYRPDIVQLAIQLGDTGQAIAQLQKSTAPLSMAKMQPPKVWFVSPTDHYETEKAYINVQVRTQDVADTAESLTFMVNQRTVASEKGKPVRPIAGEATVREFSKQVPLLIGENWIEVEAKGKEGSTQTAIILITRKGASKKLPVLWYLGAGVSTHAIPGLSLKYAAKDVTGLADALLKQKGRVYSDVKVKLLTDAQATRSNMIEEVESFFKNAALEDVAILFVSGHGMNSSAGEYYYVAYDTNPDRLSSTGVSWRIFNSALNGIKSSVLLLADTCHSGNIAGNDAWKTQANVDPNTFIREAARNGVIVFASSSGSTVSREDPSWGHGAFAKALIDGIKGEAAYKNNMVKLSFLQDYVKENVMKLTENTQQPVIPKLTGGGEFLELVLAKKE